MLPSVVAGTVPGHIAGAEPAMCRALPPTLGKRSRDNRLFGEPQEDTVINSTNWPMRQVVGITLILGCVLFLAGASAYVLVKDQNGPVIFGQPPREWLRLVFEHPTPWRWATILFIAGVLVTLVGQTALADLLRTAGDPGFARVGLVAIAFGAVLWIIDMAFRLSLDPWAGGELAKTGAIPELYTPLSMVTTVLFVIYTLLTFAGLIAYGGAVVSTNLIPHWVGWTAIVYGLAGLGLFGVMRDAPPFMHHLMPLVIGILLLVA